MRTFIAGRYETLDDRRCWYCSTDDPSFGGFSIREGRLVCATCRHRLDNGVIHYTRAFSLFRAMKGTQDEALKQLITRRTRMYWDIKYLKDNGEVVWLPFLGAALAETFEAFISEEPLWDRVIVVPLPNYDPERDHVARIVAAAGPPWEVRPVLQCVKKGSLRKGSMGADERFDARADAYACTADLTESTVLIVDDIFISGASLSGAAWACVAKGASAVYGITVARLVQPELTEVEDVDFDSGEIRIRQRQWYPMATEGRQRPTDEAQGVRVRFLCRHCPERVVAGPFAWPIETTFDCTCGGHYSVAITDSHGRLGFQVSGCRAADLQVSFE